MKKVTYSGNKITTTQFLFKFQTGFGYNTLALDTKTAITLPCHHYKGLDWIAHCDHQLFLNSQEGGNWDNLEENRHQTQSSRLHKGCPLDQLSEPRRHTQAHKSPRYYATLLWEKYNPTRNNHHFLTSCIHLYQNVLKMNIGVDVVFKLRSNDLVFDKNELWEDRCFIGSRKAYLNIKYLLKY